MNGLAWDYEVNNQAKSIIFQRANGFKQFKYKNTIIEFYAPSWYNDSRLRTLTTEEKKQMSIFLLSKVGKCLQ